MSSILNTEVGVALISETEFERLVSQSLNVFTKSSAGKLESQMHAFMQHIRTMLNLDICNYYKFDEKTAAISLAYSSRKKGLKNYLKKEDFQNIPIAKFPFLSSRLLHGRPLIIRTSADLKYFSQDFLEFWNKGAVKSALYVPVEVTEKIYGFLGFGHMQAAINWTQLDIRRLHTLCNILANALDRIYNLNELREATDKLRDLRAQVNNESPFVKTSMEDYKELEVIVDKSEAIKKVVADIQQIAHSLNPVIISGEIGTGREIFAMLLHMSSHLADKPFVQINCATLRRDLEEIPSQGGDRDELMDFSPFINSQLSDGGFLFFDHIEEMPLIFQSKLVDLLKDGWLKKNSIRVICAMREKIKGLAQHLNLRSDLLSYLGVHKIHLPPLRKRTEDIPDLTRYFVNKIGESLGYRDIQIPSSTIQKLTRYSWPGNVRELENVIEHTLLVIKEPVLVLNEVFNYGSFDKHAKVVVESLEAVNIKYIVNILEKCNWKIEGPGGASELLLINPSTLRSRMRKLGLKKPIKLR